MNIPTLPAYRFGRPYDSLAQTEVTSADGKEVLAAVGMVNPGLISRDLRFLAGPAFDAVQARPVAEMIDICRKAAPLFMSSDLPLCAGRTQSPDDYVRLASAACGMPHTLLRGNMRKIAGVLEEMELILKGLTRGVDPAALDAQVGWLDDVPVSFYPTARNLGLVLPGNSPGVHSLWLPAVALRIPVMLKPGRQDPWTPWRIINALLAAGCPREAFGFYPAAHDGAGVILSECDRAVVFGDASTVRRHVGDPRISVHGPGYSKVLIGEDRIEAWPEYVDLLVESIAGNGGRSCVNASTVVVPRHGRAIAQALAERLADMIPRPPDDPAARLAAFVDPRAATAVNARIDSALARPGAEDLSAGARSGGRRVEVDGLTYLQPTIVYCEDPGHALARTEFMFPFATVVERDQTDMLAWIGPSLAITALTEDVAFRRDLLRCPDVQRLNLGPIPTGRVRWDQPHEGNLFEFLYARRAVQDEVA